jgi:hypothetical protein
MAANVFDLNQIAFDRLTAIHVVGWVERSENPTSNRMGNYKPRPAVRRGSSSVRYRRTRINYLRQSLLKPILDRDIDIETR